MTGFELVAIPILFLLALAGAYVLGYGVAADRALKARQCAARVVLRLTRRGEVRP